MSPTSTDNASSGATNTDAKTADSAPATVTTTNAEAITPPDTGRPTPPDVAAGSSIHRPGHAPGGAVLDGPAAMTVGAHRKTSGGKTAKKS